LEKDLPGAPSEHVWERCLAVVPQEEQVTSSDECLRSLRSGRACLRRVGDQEPGEARVVEHTPAGCLPSTGRRKFIERRHPAGVTRQFLGVEKEVLKFITEGCTFR